MEYLVGRNVNVSLADFNQIPDIRCPGLLTVLIRHGYGAMPNRMLRAAKEGNWELVETLVLKYNLPGPSLRDEYGLTLLHWAVDCSGGLDEDVVKGLLEQGAQVDAEDHVGGTPLH